MSYTSKYTGSEIDTKLDTVVSITNILDQVWPIGSIYLAYNHTSPASLFGGTWTRISSQFLYGATADGTIGATGGTNTHTHTSAAHTHTIAGHTHTTAGHTLTVAEMPSHDHYFANTGRVLMWDSDCSPIADPYSYNTTDGNIQSTWNTYTAYTGGGGSHSHGNTGSTSLTTNSTTPGNTGSASNLPPYISISIWRRTA